MGARHNQGMSCLLCDSSNRLQESRPPDPDLDDLIEQAFLEAQIDGEKADLAYEFLRSNGNNRRCILLR